MPLNIQYFNLNLLSGWPSAPRLLTNLPKSNPPFREHLSEKRPARTRAPESSRTLVSESSGYWFKRRRASRPETCHLVMMSSDPLNTLSQKVA